MKVLLSFCLVGIVLATLSEEEITLTVQVGAGKTECFFIPVLKPEYSALELNYRVIKGGDHDISVNMRVPSGVEVVNDYKSRSHSHRIAIDNNQNARGDYILCLDNTFSSYTSKTVSLSLYLLDLSGNYAGDLAKIESNPSASLQIALEVFKSSTDRIKSNLNQADGELNLFRSISLEDRSKAEDIFENVNFWGIVNTSVMLIAGLAQVFLIRSLLTEGSKVGKFMRGSGLFSSYGY